MDERRDTGWEEPILQPAEELHMERDPRELQRVYDTGRAVAEKHLDQLTAFLDKAKAEV